LILFDDYYTGGDAAPALDKCALAARSLRCAIQFGPRDYIFDTRPKRFGWGLVLKGDGAVGPVPFGTRLIARYRASGDEDAFLCWDGSDGTPARGAGGGLFDLNILRDREEGGCAFSLLGDSDYRRCGWWSGRRLFVSGLSTRWDRGMLLDGMKCMTPDGAGVRDTRVMLAEFAACKRTTVELRNAVEFSMLCCSLFDAGGGPAALRVTGGQATDSRSILCCFTDTRIIGKAEFDFCRYTRFDGYALDIAVTPNADNVQLRGQWVRSLVVPDGRGHDARGLAQIRQI
jgi:hypothetical protein